MRDYIPNEQKFWYKQMDHTYIEKTKDLILQEKKL